MAFAKRLSRICRSRTRSALTKQSLTWELRDHMQSRLLRSRLLLIQDIRKKFWKSDPL